MAEHPAHNAGSMRSKAVHPARVVQPGGECRTTQSQVEAVLGNRVKEEGTWEAAFVEARG